MKNGTHSVKQDEEPEIRAFSTNYFMGWIGPSSFEWSSIICNVNCFSSLVASSYSG